MNAADQIIYALPITSIWQLLGGDEPRHGRVRAVWRGGDGRNVALDDRKGCWFDHARSEGGGVLDLIIKVNRCTRADALKWLAARSGFKLGLGADARERERWRRTVERNRRIAREAAYFADATTILAETALASLKPTDPARSIYTELLVALHQSPVAEYERGASCRNRSRGRWSMPGSSIRSASRTSSLHT